MKMCARCQECKSLDQFHVKRSAKDGKASYCKQCSSEFSKTWVASKPGYAKAMMEKYMAANRDAVLAQRREFYRANQPRMLSAVKQYRDTNKAETLASKRNYYRKNREACLAVVRKWRDENQASWYAAWASKNRAYLRAKANQRRAAELRAVPSWADAKLVDEFYITADALNMWTGEWHHVDHIVPLQGKTVCGLHSQHNLQILPAAENLSKRHLHWPDQP